MDSVKIRKLIIGEGLPKICVPIVERTGDEILNTAREIAHSPADLVEWRADWYESVFEIEKVKMLVGELREAIRDLPLLFTFRTKAEGGEKEIEFEQYKRLLHGVAATSYVDLIDVEMFFDDTVPGLISDLKNKGVKVIASNHDFVKTPSKEEIIRRLCYMQEKGADIAKLAVMPQNKKDVMTLLIATEEMASQHATGPIVTMSMSGMGSVSRVTGEIFGSSITFGTLGRVSAPGQIHVDKLKEIMEILH